MNKHYTKREIRNRLKCGLRLKIAIMKSGYFLYHGRNKYPIAWNEHRIENINEVLNERGKHNKDGPIHFLVLEARRILNGKEI